MKPRSTQLRHRAIRICTVPFAALFAVSASGADISWNGATNAVWSTGGNWVGGVAPTTTDVAVFNASSTANLSTTLGADFSIAGLKITTPSGLITIGGANTLTLGAGGIGLNVALQDLQFNALVALAAGQSRHAMIDQTLTTSAVIHGREVNLSKIEIEDLTFSGPGMFTSVASTGDGQANVTGSLRATKVEKLAFADVGTFSISAAPRANRTVEELRVSDGSGVAGSANRGGKRTVKISSRGVGKAGAKEKTVTTDVTAEDLRAALELKDGTGLLVGDEGLTLNNTGFGNTDAANVDNVTVSDANIVTVSNQNSGRQYVTSRLVPLVSPPLTGTWANVGTAWGTGTNWSGGTAPGTGDDALFNLASYTFQPAFTANAALGEFHSSGAGAITFTGTQTLTLNANGSTAGTGILVDSGAGAVNFAGVKFILGASQSWTNNSSNVVNNGAGTINTNGQTLTFNGSGSGGFNLNGVISSTGNLITNQSSGTLTLNGANSFTGTTTISAGTLIVGNTGKLGGNATTYAGNITNNGAFIYKTSASQTYSGLISGSGTLTKDTSSTFDSSQLSVLTLSNASNNYTGATTITAGTLSVSVSGNLGNAAANLVFNGGTLQITGTAITSFVSGAGNIGHTVSFTRGKTVGLDINSNANTFTVDQVLNQGTGGFIKAGAGTVILNQANTYTGNTTVNAGVLQYASTSAISGSGRNVTINPGGAVQFAAFSNADIATALGRIDTTSKGTIDPTNNLAGIFDFSSASLANTSLGAGGTTGLNVDFTGTLTPFGTTYRLGGTNSSTNNIRMATANQLSGANDVVVTGGVAYLTNQNYSGATFLNSGTLQLSGPNGAITSGAGGITFNGGALTLTNAVAENAVVRVPIGTAITSNGGTFNYNNISNASTVYAQAVGSVAITTGQLDTVLGSDMVGGGGNTQTLTLAGLTHASSATGTATFSATTTGPNATTNMINVTGGTASTNIGPWATVGTTAALQTDYAAYDASKNITAAAIAGSADSTWTSSSALYTNGTGGNVVLGATAHDMLGLRNTGATTVMKIQSGGDLHTYGLLNGVSTLWTIQQNAGAGVVTTPNGGGNLFVTTGAGAITISAPVTNSADVVPVAVSLVKSGSGTLTLSGPNTYTGGTFINAGTLTTSNATALGSNSAVTLANVAGATLNITAADISIGSLTGGGASGGNVTLGAKLTVGGDNTSPAAYAGSISGAGKLVKIGSGTLTLSGNNTYGNTANNTGDFNTDLQAGTVLIDSTNPFGNWIVNLNGPTVTLQAATTARTVTNPIWLNGTTTTVSGSQSLTFSGNVMGRGGPATLTNNITGGGTLSLTGNVFTDWASGFQTLTFNGTGNTNISAPIANNFNNFAGQNGNIIKSGAGTLTLSGTNTYTGTTTISVGVINMGNNLALQNSTVDVGSNNNAVTFAAGITAPTLGGLQGSGNLVLTTAASQAATLTVGNNNSTTTYSGILSGTGGLTKSGNGTTLTLSGTTSSFTGNISITGGTLLATGAAGGLNPTTSALGNPQTASRTMTVGSGTFLNFGANDILGNASSTVAVKTIVNGGTITNNGDFFTTLGPVDLNGGTINSIGGANASSPSFLLNGTVTVGGSAVSTISGSGAFSQMALATTATTFDVGDATSSSASDLNVSVALQGGALTKSGVGTMTLSGINTYTGTTTVSAGTLSLTGSLTGGGAITTSGTGILNQSLAGAISGASSLTQNSSGTSILAGTNSYTGDTTINAGTLQVNGTITSNTTVNDASLLVFGTVMGTVETNGISSIVVSGTISGTTTLNSGGTLSGDNSTLGNVTVNDGGTFSPGGGGIGALTVNGNLDFTDSSIFSVQFDSSAPAVDTITVTGNLNIAMGAVLNVGDIGMDPGSIYGTAANIITYSGTWNGGTFADLPDDSYFMDGGRNFQISYNGADVEVPEGIVTITMVEVIPEPCAAVSLLGGLGLLLGVRRRRA